MPPYECPAEDPNGCQKASEGNYSITFYKGFVSEATVSASAGEKLLFSQGKNNPYIVGGTPGTKPPADKFHIRLEGPGKDVLLKVDNSPLDANYKGPIASIMVVTGNPNGEPVIDPRVQVTAGKHQVLSVAVVLRGAGPERPRGGDRPRNVVEGDEVWVIQDNAQTCPKQCP